MAICTMRQVEMQRRCIEEWLSYRIWREPLIPGVFKSMHSRIVEDKPRIIVKTAPGAPPWAFLRVRAAYEELRRNPEIGDFTILFE